MKSKPDLALNQAQCRHTALEILDLVAGINGWNSTVGNGVSLTLDGLAMLETSLRTEFGCTKPSLEPSNNLISSLKKPRISPEAFRAEGSFPFKVLDTQRIHGAPVSSSFIHLWRELGDPKKYKFDRWSAGATGKPILQVTLVSSPRSKKTVVPHASGISLQRSFLTINSSTIN